MKYFLLILTIFGVIVSSLALREHYREYGDSPCSINEHWDCGVVNHSKYALVGGVFDLLGIHGHIPIISGMPVAVAGILGYILMAGIVSLRAYRWLLLFTFGSLAFSLYLANIEKNVLGVWCIYCVISLGIISLLCLFNVGAVVAGIAQRTKSA